MRKIYLKGGYKMRCRAKEETTSRNTVRLNSIVTLRCKNTEADDGEAVYETFKLMDKPEDDCVYKGISLNSRIGKALRGGIKDQKVSIEGYDNATIVEVINDSTRHKVGEDCILEVELYKDYECTDRVETKVLGRRNDIRQQLNNKEINSVVKIYYARGRAEFAKIRGIVSCQEAQLIIGKSMNRYLDGGESRKALKAVSDIQEFIVDSEDITENTIDIFEKMVICHLNNDSVVDAIDALNYLFNFKFDKDLMKKVKVMINILTKIKTNFEIVAIEEEKYFILVHLGSLHRRLRAYTKAIEIYDSAKEINDSYAGAFNGIGDALRKLERFPEAIQEYEQALVRGGNVYISYSGLGGISSDLGDFQNAIKFYDEAIKTGHDLQCGEEELIEAYKGLIAVYIKTGDVIKAQQYAELWNSIAEKLMNTDLQKALNCISGLLNTISNNPQAQDTERRILALMNCA
jgi:tetratricopeptide (TPR) repeat protein